MMMELLKRNRQGLLMAMVLAMILPSMGCFSIRNPFTKRAKAGSLKVVPGTNSEAVQLSAPDVVAILTQLSFNQTQIYEIGKDLRDGLMMYGRADIYYNGKVIATMRVVNERIQIPTTYRGYLEYDVKTHQFLVGPDSAAPQLTQPMQPTLQMPQPQAPSMPMYPSYPSPGSL